MHLTQLGKNALAQALLGEPLHFSRVAIGSGLLGDDDKIFNLTELKEFQMWLPIVDLQITGDGTANITAYLTNAELTKGFRCTEHAVFCIDPATGNEILFSYRNVGDEYDFIPSFTGGAAKNIMLSYVVEIQDAENITAQIDMSVAYVSTQDFKDHINSTAPHPNTPTKLDDIKETSAVWAIDCDNHLHKIAVEDLKNVLRENPADNLSDSDIVFDSQNELGLDANLLMIEDFRDEVVTDWFKSKVRSYAEGGNLLLIDDVKSLRTGATYILSDGTFAEEVQVVSVTKNNSGYHAKLKNPVANTFNAANLYLYRTTPAHTFKNSVTWHGAQFSGVNANLIRTVQLENYNEIQGDAVFEDGVFLFEVTK